MNPLSGLLNALLSPVQALSGADKLAGTIAAIAQALMDGKMWRSLAWILLGFVLFIVGGMLILRPHLSKAASDLGGVASLAALA